MYKRFLLFIALLLSCCALYGADELTYKRSSLTLILVSHDKGTYSDEIREEFLKMPIPDRYNGIPIDTKVFVTTATNELSQKDVTKILQDNAIGNEILGKWFDFNWSNATMDMDFIHDRGGYSAGYAQFRKAESMERGMAMLSDSGIDLLNNSFVLVCDMDYYDKEKTGQAISALLAIGSAALSIYAGTTNNRNAADIARIGSTAAAAGAIVAADIGGFSVKMHAFLYRLRWNDEVQNKFFEDYWVDSSMPEQERRARATAFASDKKSFQLDYVADYKEKTGKTVFKSANDLHQVIRDVCGNTLVAGVRTLAGSNEEFKPKSTFYCQGDTVFSYIGTKEGVNKKSKYEVVSMTHKGKNNFTYKRQAALRADQIWDNRNFNFATDSLGSVKGTSFQRETGQGVQLADMGYTLREYTPPSLVTFVSFNVSNSTESYFGGSFGMCRRVGGYGRVMLRTKFNYLAIDGGLMVRLSPAVYLYGGTGYGQYREYGSGVVADAGALFRFGAFSISYGYTGIYMKGGNNHAGTIGLGFAFGNKK